MRTLWHAEYGMRHGQCKLRKHRWNTGDKAWRHVTILFFFTSMTAKMARKTAMSTIATYDRTEADEMERRLVRLARSWLRVINARKPQQGMVNHVFQELVRDPPEDANCGWDLLGRAFVEWALAEEWLEPQDLPAEISGSG